MKRIPEKFELTEKDIKEAIAYWLNEQEIDDGIEHEFNIKFKTERVQGPVPAGAPTGGMSDWTIEVITASAEKE
jgi:hypothetical protein